LPGLRRRALAFGATRQHNDTWPEVTTTKPCTVFQKELYNDNPNVAVWRVSRKRLYTY
jgi:hypothetical protein